MFELCARESKQPPDYSGTDDYEVFLTLYGKVQDPRFLTFLEKIGRERQVSFEATDFIALDLISPPGRKNVFHYCSNPAPLNALDGNSFFPASFTNSLIKRAFILASTDWTAKPINNYY